MSEMFQIEKNNAWQIEKDDRKRRTEEEMAVEAQLLAKYFPENEQHSLTEEQPVYSMEECSIECLEGVWFGCIVIEVSDTMIQWQGIKLTLRKVSILFALVCLYLHGSCLNPLLPVKMVLVLKVPHYSLHPQW